MIVALFSGASYLRYREAAWRAFDTDLLANLDTLQAALLEETAEGHRTAGPGASEASPVLPSGPKSLRRAAQATVEEFRLNGMYAEIREGGEVPTVLARMPGAGLGPDARLFDDSVWREIVRSPATLILPVGKDRRAAIRGLPGATGRGPIAIAVADRTALVERTLASIRRSLFEFGTAGLLLALAGGYWLATRALRPIDTLTTQAGRMAETASTPGSHRLEVANPDDELGRLALTFNRLLERIESSVTQMRDFIADAAHELKTPVTVVRTEAELSLSSDRSREEYRESLQAIAGESAHLSHLVSDLTLLAEGQMLEHPLERRLVDLNELIHEVARSLRSVAANRNVLLDIESSGGVEYRGDERLLRQIFTNLIENAIKFSRPGARVGVVLSEDSGSREIRILDEAPTLSPADRERVFERFYRSQQARTSGETGSGLGLAIVQWAVTLHGGRVRVAPRESVGNMFIVNLPVALESAERG